MQFDWDSLGDFEEAPNKADISQEKSKKRKAGELNKDQKRSEILG